MAEKRSIVDRFFNWFYAIPTVAQIWASRSAANTRQIVELDDAIPFTRLVKPLANCRVALITTGGIHLPSQRPFDMENPDGDPSYREIPGDVALDSVTITHKYYDHRDADRDINVIFPLDHLRELVAQEVLGSIAPRHFGFMGHIDQDLVEVLNRETAPDVAAKLRDDQVDFTLLTPA